MTAHATVTDLEIALFGALAGLCNTRSIRIRVALPCSAADVRTVLDAMLTAGEPSATLQPLRVWLEQSALADDTHVLAYDDLVEGQRRLALLPPVCGG
jgi:hypothetical protein